MPQNEVFVKENIEISQAAREVLGLKSQTELKDVDTTNTSSWIPTEVFTDMVATAARPNLVMRDTAARVDRSLIGSPGNKAVFRDRGTTSFTSVNEASEISTGDDVEHNVTNVTVSKLGRRINLTDEAMEDSIGVGLSGLADELGAAFAKKNDSDAYSEVADTSISNEETVTVNSDGEISVEEVVQLAKKLAANDYPSNELVSPMHPDFIHDLLTDTSGVTVHDAAAFGNPGNGPIYTGEVGQVGGVRILETSQANSSTSTTGTIQAVMYHPDRAFVEAIKRELRIEPQRDASKDLTEVNASTRYGHSEWFGEAIGHLKNA